MDEHKDSGPGGQYVKYHEKARDRMMAGFQMQREKIAKEEGVNIGMDKFVSRDIWADNELNKQTVGLIHLEGFQKIREEINKRQLDEEARKADDENLNAKRKKIKKKPTLSFYEDEFTDTNEIEIVKFKIKKDPSIDTSFLPDHERDEKEKEDKEKLRKEWLAEQEKIKNEKIVITCSYWDGSGHRKNVECKKGDTISNFLEYCSRQWTELRGVKSYDLIYVKEDIIVPHHYTFYDFIANRIRGKSGPLFSFDVHEDIRLLNDATVETEESHAGKVVRRGWYEKNKHIFPASRWEVFNPRKDYGRYAIKDKITHDTN